MRTDEELIAEHNIQIIASALLDVMNVFVKSKVVRIDISEILEMSCSISIASNYKTLLIMEIEYED
jgi:hypothetical protein